MREPRRAQDYMHDLLDHVFNTGLSPQLIEALTQLVTHIPSLLQLIEERLIHELSVILTKTAGTARCCVRVDRGGGW